MNDIGTIYLQYWVQLKVAQTFPKCLKILKTHFIAPRQFNQMANHMEQKLFKQQSCFFKPL
jgi:hypothetical protein